MKFRLILFLILFVGAQAAWPVQAEEHVPGQMIFQLSPNASIETVIVTLEQEYSTRAGIAIEKCLSKRMQLWLMRYDENKIPAERMLQSLQQMDGVVQLAQFNHYITYRNTPNDSLFSNQWNMENTGQNGLMPGADISAPEAWDIATGGLTVLGDTIVVAVIDAGFDLAHEDINFWINHDEIPGDSIDNDNNGYIDDYRGWNATNSTGSIPNDSHGTHVSGIVGAKGNNNKGVTGVNWNVKVMPVKTQVFESEVLEAYGYVLNERMLYDETDGTQGSFVVATNSSFGIDQANASNYPAWCNFYDSLGRYGILSAAATANLAVNVDVVGDMPSTCASNFLIMVTNTTGNDVRSNIAAFGPNLVDIAAPGTAVLSTTPGNNYGAQTGTSMASPHIAGTVGLMFSGACGEFMEHYKADPAGNAIVLKEYIFRGVDSLPNLQSEMVSGGRLNLYKTMLQLDSYGCTPCMTVQLVANPTQCYGEANGAIDVFVSGNQGIVNYSWSNGSVVKNQANLSKGYYFVTAKDGAGCVVTQTAYVSSPDPLDISKDITGTTPGNDDGTSTAYPSGGTPPYSYQWSDNTGQTTQQATGLAAGNYTVTITDDNGCTAVESVHIPVGNGVGDSRNLSQPGFIVSPNPVQAELVVRLEGNNPKTPINITITDVLGRQQMIVARNQRGVFYVNMHNWPEGMYWISVKQGNTFSTQKFLKID